jgi:3-oxoacyl-[acyl-carrier protein] reductase
VQNDLFGKYVVVTGAASGIGLGIVQSLLGYGCNVIAIDKDEMALSSLAVSEDLPGRIVLLGVCNLANLAELSKLFGELDNEVERIDAWVNNAGVTIKSDFLQTSLEYVELQFNVNLRATYLCSQYAARAMVAKGVRGSIVQIGSNHSGASVAGFEAYAATKGAIASMTRAMAWSLGEYGIRVNTVSPGLTLTAAIQDAIEKQPELGTIYPGLHATNRINAPQDIGEVVAFVISDASRSVTGVELFVDNGMSAKLFNRTY